MTEWSETRGRAIVYERSQRRCEVCGRPAASVHHRNKEGRIWSPGNLLSLCGDGTRYCHGWIEHHPKHARALGLWVPRVIDPLTVPMYVKPAAFLRGWWHADDEGMWHWLDDNAPPDDEPRRDAVAALTAARLTWV